MSKVVISQGKAELNYYFTNASRGGEVGGAVLPCSTTSSIPTSSVFF